MTEHIYYSPPISFSTLAKPTPQTSSTDMNRTLIVSDLHKISQYIKHQKGLYQRTEFPTYSKGHSPKIKNFINLELVNKKRESKEEKIEGMTDKLHGNIASYVQQREPLGIEQIAEMKDGEKIPRNILIEGDPGVGKTTLVWELCRGWGENRLLQQWHVVVLIQLRDVDTREASNLEQLLDPHEQFRSELDYIKSTCGNAIMIIFDGYDELSQKQKQRTSVVQQLLCGKLLPGATLLVTSRPSATRELPVGFREHLHEHIEVVGFSDKDINKYIKCKFCDNSDVFKDFQSYMSCHPFIYKAMYIPLHCALVTDLYQRDWRKGNKAFAPQTISQLYTCFTNSLLERYLDDHPIYGPRTLCVEKLTDLPQDVYDDLMKLAELAVKGIEEQQYVFDNLTHNTLGLMQRVSDSASRNSNSVSYSFLHLTLQEYLAALYWSKCSSEELCHVFTESGTLPVEKYVGGKLWDSQVYSVFRTNTYKHEDSNIHWQVLHFYGGLTGVLGTPLDTILGDIKSTSVNHNVLYLLFESQNPEYISTILKQNQYDVEIWNKLQGYITGYCVSHCSSTAKWKIRDHSNYLLQSLVSGTSSSMGGMIKSLQMLQVTDYSKTFEMLFQLERYTNELSYLRVSNFFSFLFPLFEQSKSHADNVRCDELSYLHRHCPKLQTIILDAELNCTPLFSQLHLMTCLETLHLESVVIDDSSHTVSNGLRQTTTLKSLILSNCDLINLSPEGLSQNKSIVSLKLDNIKMNTEVSKALNQIFRQNITLLHLNLISSFRHFNCELIEERSISPIMGKELFKGIQQSKSLKQLSLHDFQLFGLEEIRKNSTLTSLQLTSRQMNKEGAMALKQVLIENKTLREMTLLDCIRSVEVAEVVAEGLRYNTGVTKLKLVDIRGAGVLGTLLQGLTKNSILTSLDMSLVNLDKTGAMTLKEVLINNSTLREMTLSNSIKTMEVVELVAEGLQYNTGVIKLTLSTIDDDGKLIKGIKKNSTLTSLNLFFQDFNEEGAMTLKEVLLENKTLREMTLSNFTSSVEVAEVVVDGLNNSTGVTKLQLQNIEGDDVIGTLIQGLENNSTISSLVFANVNLHNEGSKALKQVLLENKTLREITLHNCFMSIEAAEVVVDGLNNSTGVTKLQLQNIEGDDVIGTLIQGLENNSTISSLVFANVNLHNEGSKALKQVLLENKTLREITLHNCFMSIEAAEVVVDGLNNSTGVTKLQLQNIEGDDVIGTFIQGLENNSTISSLVFANVNLHNEGSKALKQVLLENKTLREITLHNCFMSIEAAEVVVDGLNNSTGVTKLQLQNIEGDDVIGTLIQGLENNSTISSLVFANVNLHNEGSKALKQVLLENKTLREITLHNCFMSIEAAEVVVDGLNNSTGVTKLQLQNIEGDDVIGTLIQGLENNSTISSLVFANVNLHNEGSKALKQVLLENKTLREITLHNCFMSIEAAEVVVDGLNNSTGVTKLQLQNIEGDDVIGTLIQGLENNSTISSLVFANVNLHNEGSKALKQVLLENKTLREITLHNCFMSIEAAEVIVDGLNNSTGVTKLQLQNIEGDDVIRTLIQGLENNSTITSLFLYNVKLVKEGAPILKELLLENTTLRELTLSKCIKSVEVAEIVADGLQMNTGVTKLKLSLIEGDDVIRTVVQGLRNMSSLTSLDLSVVNLHNEGSMTLQTVLIENMTLREITLHNCIKSAEAAEIVAEGLERVTKLTLSRIKGDGSFRTLIQRPSYNSLKCLILTHNDMSIKDYYVLIILLKLNKTLKYLTIGDYIDLRKAEYLAYSLDNTNLEEIRLFDKIGTMGHDGAKVLADAVVNNTVNRTTLILSDRYQQELSIYPVDRVMYKSADECKLYDW